MSLRLDEIVEISILILSFRVNPRWLGSESIGRRIWFDGHDSTKSIGIFEVPARMKGHGSIHPSNLRVFKIEIESKSSHGLAADNEVIIHSGIQNIHLEGLNGVRVREFRENGIPEDGIFLSGLNAISGVHGNRIAFVDLSVCWKGGTSHEIVGRTGVEKGFEPIFTLLIIDLLAKGDGAWSEIVIRIGRSC